ncbi:unnamed protein product [Periconia digitata]|uniref:Uncharacterized protein n=1 Tax=Periconia digitata TaxID=1303443 RepID=A0A9W4UKY0_9PLEO|nr:unnamed protein product [Periconia digitata]
MFPGQFKLAHPPAEGVTLIPLVTAGQFPMLDPPALQSTRLMSQNNAPPEIVYSTLGLSDGELARLLQPSVFPWFNE